MDRVLGAGACLNVVGADSRVEDGTKRGVVRWLTGWPSSQRWNWSKLLKPKKEFGEQLCSAVINKTLSNIKKVING